MIRNQAETAQDAESKSEHLRIQQYAIFRFTVWSWKNCTVRYALKIIQIELSARYVIRNQPHHVHDRSHMLWHVYHELPGKWYEIKQKQYKMPKARGNIYVYSSTRFSGLFFDDEKTVAYDIHLKWLKLNDLPGKYVKRNQPHDVLHRLTWCDMYNTNCHVCDTKGTTLCSWSISHVVICIPRTARQVIRNQQKQHKMPKARANICLYSSTWFSGLLFEDEKTVPCDMH